MSNDQQVVLDSTNGATSYQMAWVLVFLGFIHPAV